MKGLLLSAALLATPAQVQEFDFSLKDPIYTCVIAVITPQGTICVKPNGEAELPPELELSDASRKFWDEIAKTYTVIKNEKCI